MQKFIHDDFELDLSNYQINRVEENQWFNDQFFTKYTFPFDLKLSNELNAYFGALLDYNVAKPVTLYKGYLFIDGGHHEAILEIKELVDRVATVEVSYGFENLPGFDKKLSELPLQKETLAESLFDHAEDIIVQTWPAVNYNFVQVHTDSFNPEDERWNGFQKIINNYKDGAFLVNEFDVVDNITYNRNIMIPMPYFLHVLVQGFLSDGYALKGDVLTDPELQKMLFFKETEEYVNARLEGEELVEDISTYDSTESIRYSFGFGNFNHKTTQVAHYSTLYEFPYPGRYKVSGNVYLRRENSHALTELFFQGGKLAEYYEDFFRSGFSSKIRTVDLVIDVENVSDKLEFRSVQINYAVVNDTVDHNAPLWDVTITPLAIYDEFGALIPPIVTTQKLDLTKCVPDITFGDFVKAIKNWKNMDLKPVGRDIYMDYIQPQMNVEGAIDFSKFNIKKPRRKFSQGNSFLLQFRKLENENYSATPIFVDIDGSKTSGFKTDELTSEITINAVPLPNVFRDGVTTALAVDKGESNICVVVYAGAPSKLNVADDNSQILLPYIYANCWKEWIDFRLKSQSFTSSFKAFENEVKGLTTFSKVFMYNNYHIIKTITKTNIPGKELFVVELEMDNLK